MVVLLAAGAGWLLTRPSEPDLTGTVEPARGILSAPAVAVISAPAAQAKCRAPEPAGLAAAATFAFAGTVTGVAADRVVLRVTRVYRGEQVGEVRVEQAGDASETMLGSGKFENGKDYLVAAAGTEVMICGYSGEAGSPGLRELYDKAF